MIVGITSDTKANICPTSTNFDLGLENSGDELHSHIIENFENNIIEQWRFGVKVIIQPGGSVRDKESILEANKSKVKMIFTGVRHFNH